MVFDLFDGLQRRELSSFSVFPVLSRLCRPFAVLAWLATPSVVTTEIGRGPTMPDSPNLALGVFAATLAATFIAAFLARKHAAHDQGDALAGRWLNRWLVGLCAGTTASSGFIVTAAPGLGYTYGLQWCFSRSPGCRATSCFGTSLPRASMRSATVAGPDTFSVVGSPTRRSVRLGDFDPVGSYHRSLSRRLCVSSVACRSEIPLRRVWSARHRGVGHLRSFDHLLFQHRWLQGVGIFRPHQALRAEVKAILHQQRSGFLFGAGSEDRSDVDA
jgi:hypothetical protein